MNNKENEIGPTEELRDQPTPAEQEEGIPGVQNPDSDEIKDEQNPNTE